MDNIYYKLCLPSDNTIQPLTPTQQQPATPTQQHKPKLSSSFLNQPPTNLISSSIQLSINPTQPQPTQPSNPTQPSPQYSTPHQNPPTSQSHQQTPSKTSLISFFFNPPAAKPTQPQSLHLYSCNNLNNNHSLLLHLSHSSLTLLLLTLLHLNSTNNHLSQYLLPTRSLLHLPLQI